MKYDYEPPTLKKNYENEKWMIKKFGKDFALSYEKFINFVNCADNAFDIKASIQYFMEHDKQNMDMYYSITLDKKKSKRRVILMMLDEQDQIKKPGQDEPRFLKSIKKIRIRRISEHYGEYK